MAANGCTIQSLENALDLLELFGELQGDAGLSLLSRELGLKKGRVFRLLKTLETKGYVAQSAKTGQYGLGPAAWEVGQKLLGHMPLLRRAKPRMELLARECAEAAYLGVPSGQELLLIDMAGTTRPVCIASLVGRRYPLQRNAPGIILQAFNADLRKGLSAPQRAALAGIRRQGFCADTGGLGDDVASLAAPVLNGQGRALGSLCLIGPHFRLCGPRVEELLLPRLKAAAEAISG